MTLSPLSVDSQDFPIVSMYQCVDASLVTLPGLALPEDSAGDGNRKYRWRALAFWNVEVASATGAACDFCAKSSATRANGRQ